MVSFNHGFVTSWLGQVGTIESPNHWGSRQEAVLRWDGVSFP